jgi:hypothetical protein
MPANPCKESRVSLTGITGKDGQPIAIEEAVDKLELCPKGFVTC